MNRDFRRLWASVAVNSFGSALTGVALPLIALFTVHASPVQLGALVAIEQVAWLAFGLPAGVWVDRWSRRRVLVAADLTRAVLIGLIPLAAALGGLQLWMLFGVGLLVGVANVFGGIAHSALVPQIVERAGLLDANARINLTDTAAGLSGSAAVGPIVTLLGAPVALVVDAVSFLFSAVVLRGIAVTPIVRDNDPGRTSFRTELIDGIRIVLGEPLFRTLTLGSAAFNAATAAQYVLQFLFLRELNAPKFAYGWLLAAAGVGALVGSAAVGRLTRRWPDASVWRAALVAGPVVGLLVPLARPGWGLIAYVVGTFGLAAAVAVTSIIGFSARQAACPPELLGRVSATGRMITWGVIPLAALVGGALGGAVGVRPALWIIAAALFAEPTIIRSSRLWHWRTFDAPTEPAERKASAADR